MQALQTLVVLNAVAASTLFAFWRLSPVGLRLKLLECLAPLAKHLGQRWWVALRQRTLAQLQFGCQACSASGKSLARKA